LSKYNQELKVAIDAIKKASKVVMDIYHDDFTINIKNDNSEVTNADIASENLIREELHKHFPTYSILSEETADDLERIDNDYCWIVDPIDGTKDFVNKTDNFAINIALAYKNEIVLGMISVPCKKLIYYAIKGQGAYKITNDNIEKIHVSKNVDKLTMVTSKFFSKGNSKYENDKLINKMVSIGSSYKACLIAEGQADICIKEDPYTKEWDTAPSEIILREAGGIMTNLFGEVIKYNKKDVYNHEGFIIANSNEVLNHFKKER
jgi:3'(2'), 5'-bisphosphate nucleotidase